MAGVSVTAPGAVNSKESDCGALLFNRSENFDAFCVCCLLCGFADMNFEGEILESECNGIYCSVKMLEIYGSQCNRFEILNHIGFIWCL